MREFRSRDAARMRYGTLIVLAVCRLTTATTPFVVRPQIEARRDGVRRATEE
jgi:hypothetical protein